MCVTCFTPLISFDFIALTSGEEYLSLKMFIATCFDQCGHHQVTNLLDEETAVFCFIAYVVPSVCMLYSFLLYVVLRVLHSKTRQAAQQREAGWGSMGWIDLAQDRDQWKTLVNTVMKLRVP
jgi:hypothetical protein